MCAHNPTPAAPGDGEPPVCHRCRVPLVKRDPPGGWTYEQRFCGTWWDHPPGSGTLCRYMGVLDPSPELQAQLAQQQQERSAP